MISSHPMQEAPSQVDGENVYSNMIFPLQKKLVSQPIEEMSIVILRQIWFSFPQNTHTEGLRCHMIK